MVKSKRGKKKQSGLGRVIGSLKSFGSKGRSKRLKTLFVSPNRTRPY